MLRCELFMSVESGALPDTQLALRNTIAGEQRMECVVATLPLAESPSAVRHFSSPVATSSPELADVELLQMAEGRTLHQLTRCCMLRR